MPPTPDVVPLPDGRAGDAADWLAAQGLVARTPPLTASARQVSLDPFTFFLTYRLGIRSAFSTSDALSHGGWVHRRFECASLPSHDAAAFMRRHLDTSITRLRALCQYFLLDSDRTRDILVKEEQDALNAWAWFDACATLPSPDPASTDGGPFRDGFLAWLSHPAYRVLGNELTLSCRDPRYPKTPLACRIDRLIYHIPSNTIWIIDYKSCDGFPDIRGTVCPNEFQSLHYLNIVGSLIDAGLLQHQYNLPADCRLGGIYHVILQKPSIRFGSADRDYTLDTTPFKTGPRKGLPRNEKVYTGEPVFANFVARCRRWYAATDEYIDHAADRRAHPPINLSTTHVSVLDEDRLHEYHLSLSSLYHYCTCPPHPRNFPRSSNGMLDRYGRITPFAPFHDAPVHTWPDLIRTKHLTVIEPEYTVSVEADDPAPLES